MSASVEPRRDGPVIADRPEPGAPRPYEFPSVGERRLSNGLNLLVVDLFPPTPRDPQGIHKAIWDEFGEEPFAFLPDKPLTVASYIGGDIPTAYVESVGVGDVLPSMPIFLSEDHYVPAPLEVTYLQAWAVYPAMLKELIEPPAA